MEGFTYAEQLTARDIREKYLQEARQMLIESGTPRVQN